MRFNSADEFQMQQHNKGMSMLFITLGFDKRG
jgi:hypothetical protein